MNLEKRLAANGYKGGKDQFKKIVVERLKAFWPGQTIDELLCHPRIAIRFCDMVREEVNCHGLPDDLILRIRLGKRKRPIDSSPEEEPPAATE